MVEGGLRHELNRMRQRRLEVIVCKLIMYGKANCIKFRIAVQPSRGDATSKALACKYGAVLQKSGLNTVDSHRIFSKATVM